MRKLFPLAMVILVAVGLTLRLWHINFGLPHSWYADEPEIGEFAIKYTYEFRSILENNDVYKLVPQSYVYGTFPVYMYTLATMAFSKALNVLQITFGKTDLYVFMRVLNSLMDLLIIPAFYLLLKELGLTRKPILALLGTFLVTFSWKLIVHAHYLNHDILITLFTVLANVFFIRYIKAPAKANLIGFALLYGLALSTKITTCLILPLYLLPMIRSRKLLDAATALVIMTGVFMITNPFSWIFINEFLGRLLEMRWKEAGMVFDSVDYSPYKYLIATADILSWPILALALLGLGLGVRNGQSVKLVLIGQIIIYLIFFSLQARRVDRWLLPIVPNLILFSLVGIDYLNQKLKHRWRLSALVALVVIAIFYLYKPTVLIRQFGRQTPKSEAYIWAKDNLPPTATKFGITEEGLDPMNKLPLATIWQFNVYASEGAHLVLPPDPRLYDYIIISSRPMAWTKKPEVTNKYPYYAAIWSDFQVALSSPQQFQLIKRFELSEPNLIPLSNVYIYKKVT